MSYFRVILVFFTAILCHIALVACGLRLGMTSSSKSPATHLAAFYKENLYSVSRTRSWLYCADNVSHPEKMYVDYYPSAILVKNFDQEIPVDYCLQNVFDYVPKTDFPLTAIRAGLPMTYGFTESEKRPGVVSVASIRVTAVVVNIVTWLIFTTCIFYLPSLLKRLRRNDPALCSVCLYEKGLLLRCPECGSLSSR